ncbi:UcrQ family-domain-containing protein [Jimgerdemannia flammicorona]|uniref:Cytochrome b-c1 complex subunit 8 n=1 Tax=Jimgerdemannia flammicorona TaxID=994334 RepID=A0A433QCP7_9FUNG|nr:UcrQ family-domain-containing protein [Jimgerdemannia flammicorona]
MGGGKYMGNWGHLGGPIQRRTEWDTCSGCGELPLTPSIAGNTNPLQPTYQLSNRPFLFLNATNRQGIVVYSLSPFEQRALAGALHNAIFNTTRRIISQVPYIGIPGFIGYSIFSWGKGRHEFLASKAGGGH